jgi:L-amino acid N-acyltransferase YncA
MTPLSPTSNRNARPITVADLERVIAIDQVHSGHSRRHFFEKRFANAKARPDDFVHVGIAVDGLLRGFAIARILRGEFGHKDAVAVLDAVGVDPEGREHGIGQSLMEGLIKVSRQQGVRSLQSQVSWTNLDLLRFFNASRFELAPRLALERSVAELREEVDEEV